MISTEKPSFRVAVCGAGIAGLCAAIGLAQQGHHVTVLESAHELHPIGIGIHLPPNATLVLKHFGLLDRLRPDAMSPSTFAMRRWDDNRVLGSTPETESHDPEKDTVPYWTMRRSDYQRHLYDGAVETGCKVRLGARVTSLDADLPSVTLEGGEVIDVDMIVVADGISSKLREMLIPEENVTLVGGRFSCYRAYVSEEDLLSDPITAPAFKNTPTNIWIGYNRHIIVYPCGGGLCTIGAIYPAETPEAMAWNQFATTEEARKDFRGWHEAVDRVLFHARDVKKWRLAETPLLPRWTSKSGRAVLVGDAAHAMYPMLAQGAAMATEDALALAECVGRVKRPEDLPAVMQAFERSRKWRCEIMQTESRRSGEVMHIADGPEQEERDKKMGGLPYNNDFWEPDCGPLIEPKFQAFLYGHNVIEHTHKILDSLSL